VAHHRKGFGHLPGGRALTVRLGHDPSL
jgi:hypothetical protein